MAYWLSNNPKKAIIEWLPQVTNSPIMMSQSPNMSTVNWPATGWISRGLPPKPKIPNIVQPKIGWINAPAIWSDFGTIKWAEQTQLSNFPAQVKENISQSIQQPLKSQIQQSEAQTTDIKQPLLDLWATILANKYSPDELQTKFPEFSKLDKQTFLDLWATLQAKPNLTPDEILQKFPELSQWWQQEPSNILPAADKAISKMQDYDGFGKIVVNWIWNYARSILWAEEETGKWLKNIFERW